MSNTASLSLSALAGLTLFMITALLSVGHI